MEDHMELNITFYHFYNLEYQLIIEQELFKITCTQKITLV